MKTELIENAYAAAKARYAESGIDTDKVLEELQATPIGLPCLPTADAGQTGKDVEKAMSLLGGTFRFGQEGDFGSIAFAAFVTGIRSEQKKRLVELLGTDFQLQEKDEKYDRLIELGSSVEAVWNFFHIRNGVPVDEDFLSEIERYTRS